MDYINQLENQINRLNSENTANINKLADLESKANVYYTNAEAYKKELAVYDKESVDYKRIESLYNKANTNYINTKKEIDTLNESIFNNKRELGRLKQTITDYNNTVGDLEINEDYEEEPPILVKREVDYSLSTITKQLDKLYELDLYVYIAGVYIPVSSVTISSSFGGTPSASISVPPDPVFLGIGREDRVPVQIFIKDTFSGITANVKYRIPILYNMIGNERDYDNYIKEKNIKNNKILLFSGVITSYSYVTTPDSRMVNIVCDTDLNVLTDLRILHAADVNGLLIEYADGTSGSTKKNLVDPRYLPVSLFYKGFNIKTITGNDLVVSSAPPPPNTTDMNSIPGNEKEWQDKELFRVPGDFMDNMVSFVSTGDTNPKSDLVSFYTEYSKLLRTRQRYLKIPFFDNEGGVVDGQSTFPILAALQTDSAAKFVGEIAQNLGVDTPYDFINSLASLMEYDFALLSTPICRVTPDGVPRLGQMLLKPMMYEAIPPTCNIIQKEHVLEVNYGETVHGVPTRLIARSVDGVAGILGMPGSSEMLTALNLFYPMEYDKSMESLIKSDNAEATPYSGGLLATAEVNEKFTGPFVHKVNLPAWLDYLNLSNSDKESYAKSKNKLTWAKHMWIMLRSEYKTATVTMTFNPYITIGAPAIVIDADTYEGFSLIGYVVSVEHFISKGAATTTVGLNFPRMLSDELKNNGEFRLTNTLEEITNITQDATKAGIIYKYIYGCNAYDFTKTNTFSDNNRNPRKAYINNWRDICTLEEFYDFLAYDPTNPQSYKNWRSNVALKHREATYYKIDIPYLTNRRDPELVNKLTELRKKIIASDIYRQDNTII